MGRFIFGLVMAAMFLAWAGPATAQAVCGDRDQIVAIAEKKYHERLILRALSKRGSVLEIFSNEGGTSWTALVTHANGRTCVVDAGENLETHVPAYGQGS